MNYAKPQMTQQKKLKNCCLRALFKAHPMKHPVGGFPKTIKRLTLDQLSNAHETNYVPQNMILILTGNFSEKTSQEVLKMFGNKTFDTPVSKKVTSC